MKIAHQALLFVSSWRHQVSALDLNAALILENLRIYLIINGLETPSILSIDMIPAPSKYHLMALSLFSLLYFSLKSPWRYVLPQSLHLHLFTFHIPVFNPEITTAILALTLH